MREEEKIRNQRDEKQDIVTPVIWAAAAVCAIIGLFIWFGIKQPNLFNNIRDLVLTLILFLVFIFNTVVAIFSFLIAGRLNNARDQLDKAITAGDGKVEELADKTVILLGKILEPFINIESSKAGILSIFTKK